MMFRRAEGAAEHARPREEASSVGICKKVSQEADCRKKRLPNRGVVGGAGEHEGC